MLGWPEQIGDALPRRGDVDVLVVDALGEGSGLVRRLQRADVDAIDVPMSGLGAAVADSDLVLLEASAFGPGGWVGVAGSLRRGRGGASRRDPRVGRRRHRPCAAGAACGRPSCARLDDDMPWEAEDDVVPSDLCDVIVGRHGALPLADALRRIDCPIAPELYKPTT